jgi:hypothetical protein
VLFLSLTRSFFFLVFAAKTMAAFTQWLRTPFDVERMEEREEREREVDPARVDEALSFLLWAMNEHHEPLHRVLAAVELTDKLRVNLRQALALLFDV